MTDSALPPVDIQMAAQRLELLAQIYQSTQPQDHVIKPLPNTPSWLGDLDAKIPEVNLEQTLQLYLDCKAQPFGAAKLQGEILQGVVEKGKIADAKAQKFFGNLESQFAKAPVYYLQSLGFTDVSVTAQTQSYKFSAKYKNLSVEFYEFSGDDSINFVKAATEIKSFIDSPNVSLSAIQVIQFADSSEDYTFTLRKKVENMAGGEAYQHTVETRYYLPMGLLSAKNYTRLEASYDKII